MKLGPEKIEPDDLQPGRERSGVLKEEGVKGGLDLKQVGRGGGLKVEGPEIHTGTDAVERSTVQRKETREDRRQYDQRAHRRCVPQEREETVRGRPRHFAQLIVAEVGRYFREAR